MPSKPRIFLFWRNRWNDRLYSWGFIFAPQWDGQREGEEVKCGLRIEFAFGPSRFEIEDRLAHRWRPWPVSLRVRFGRGPEPRTTGLPYGVTDPVAYYLDVPQQIPQLSESTRRTLAFMEEMRDGLAELCYSEPPSPLPEGTEARVHLNYGRPSDQPFTIGISIQKARLPRSMFGDTSKWYGSKGQ